MNNMAAALEAVKGFNMEVIIIPKSAAGTDAKAPAVYLDDTVLVVDGDERNGKITTDGLKEALKRANVLKYPPKPEEK